MACQGCGRVTATTRLCCPTCIEYGRTSFFCSQDCFTKNWKSHGQLHDLLKKKKALGTSGADAGADPDLEVQQSSAARQKTEDMPVPASSRRAAPLAGGMSMVSNYGAEKRNMNGAAAAKRRQDEAAAGAGLQGMLGSVVGSTWSLVSSPFRGSEAEPTAAGKQSAAAAAGSRRPSGPTSGATTAQAKGGAAGAKGPWWTTLTRRFALNGLLWALALTTILASGMFWREHSRYAEDQRPDQVALDIPGERGMDLEIKTEATAQVVSSPVEDAPAQAEPTEAPAAADASTAASAAAPLLAGLSNALGAAAPSVPPADGSGSASSSQVNALRGEVTALRELVERHDKMLRYVMDRYVEKAVSGSSGASKDSGAHEVSFESVSKSANTDYELGNLPSSVLAGRGDTHRKRRGAGDAAPMGSPEIEGEGLAAAPSELQIEAQASTTLLDVPHAASQDTSQNQLGIMN